MFESSDFYQGYIIKLWGKVQDLSIILKCQELYEFVINSENNTVTLVSLTDLNILYREKACRISIKKNLGSLLQIHYEGLKHYTIICGFC